MGYKIAIVGECYGEQEVQWGRSFVGGYGDELNRILNDAGINRGECFLTDVFKVHLPRADPGPLCSSKAAGPHIPGWPAIGTGKYLLTEHAHHVERLVAELKDIRPNVALALGDLATWALLRTTKIKSLRGTAAVSPVVEGLKVIPAYHPATILADYSLRHVTVLDFLKAKRESEFPELVRPTREFWLDPTLADIERFYNEHWHGSPCGSFDIETASGQITCIGFAPSVDRALVIPFWDYRNPTGSYWPDLASELAAWRWVKKFLAAPCRKVAQNGLYDIQYLWYVYGIPVAEYEHDTMLLHHSLQPESPKGLDFLGSVYTNEPAWKTHRPRGEHTIKREE